MRLSFRVDAVPYLPLRDLLLILRDAGYGVVESSWARVANELSASCDRVTTFNALLNEHDLSLTSLQIADMAATEEGELGEVVGAMCEQMRFARELGLSSVSFSSGDRRRQTMDVLVRGIKAVVPTAVELGLTIGLANRYGSRIEQLDDLNSLMIELDEPRLRFVINTGAYHDASVNPRDAIRAFSDQIDLVRIADRIGRRPVPLGQGELNVAAVVGQLQQIGYTGRLVVDTPHPHAADALSYLLDRLAR